MADASTSRIPVDGLGCLEMRDGPLQSDFGQTVPGTTYDVFINHRGPDVKKTMVSHLCAALKRLNFSYFVDYEGLQIGDRAKAVIKSAIKHSKVHIAVFTPDYANSEWCLDELYFIMESTQKGSTELFLPVFFNVKPSDLRLHRESCYDSPLEERAKTIKEEVIKKWKKALCDAADVKGLIFPDDFQGFEANLVEDIVSRIFKVLTRSTLLHGPKHPVGVDEKLQQALHHMKSGGCSRANVKTFGIHGMGGMGKTTLAKSIYNRTLREFDSACFIQNVSENHRLKGLASLQQDLLNKLLKTEFPVTDTAYGKQLMQERLKERKVLIILDDVDKKVQLDELLPSHDCCLGEGSQIVVTTRDQQVCQWADAKTVFPVEGLSRDLSRQLFNMHAFPSEGVSPLSAEVENDLAEKVADICQGLPLALEVFGSCLKGKDISVWRNTVTLLERNKKVAPMHTIVTENLKISFNSLESEEKEMFLDIACFMLEEPRDKAMRIWKSDSSVEEAKHQLENLVCKCLVKVDTNGNLIMHDLLRNMGRQIASESHKNYWERSHLWRDEEVNSIHSKRKGKKSMSCVRGLISSVKKEWHTSSFSDMDELKLLVLNEVTLTGDFRKFSKELIWLQLRHCSCDGISSWRYLDNLVVLDLEGSGITSFSCGDDMLQNLTELSLKDCSDLVEFLINFSKSSKHLEVLQLSGCVNLEQLPESIGDLSSSLTYLGVSQCRKLVSLPHSIGRLSKLEVLNLEGCSNLCEIRGLPRSVTSLAVDGCIGLKHLDLRSSGLLRALPDGVESLCNLLQLSNCYDKRVERSQWWNLDQNLHQTLLSLEEHVLEFPTHFRETLGAHYSAERYFETVLPASFNVDECSGVECRLLFVFDNRREPVSMEPAVELKVIYEDCQIFSKQMMGGQNYCYTGIFRRPHPLISSLIGGAIIRFCFSPDVFLSLHGCVRIGIMSRERKAFWTCYPLSLCGDVSE